MKKLITLIGLSLALCASAAETKKPSDSWAFSKGEWSVDSYYTARFSGDFNHAQQGVGFGVGYSLTRNLVAQVRGVSYNDDPQFINEVVGRLTYRAPLSFLSPKIAPYAFTEGGGNLQTGVGFGGAGGGIEWRPLAKRFGAKLGLFGEADVRLDTEWRSSVGVSGGLRLSF